MIAAVALVGDLAGSVAKAHTGIALCFCLRGAEILAALRPCTWEYLGWGEWRGLSGQLKSVLGDLLRSGRVADHKILVSAFLCETHRRRRMGARLTPGRHVRGFVSQRLLAADIWTRAACVSRDGVRDVSDGRCADRKSQRAPDLEMGHHWRSRVGLYCDTGKVSLATSRYSC